MNCLENYYNPSSPTHFKQPNVTFSTPEGKKKSEEKHQLILQHTPKPRCSKRKSLIKQLATDVSFSKQYNDKLQIINENASDDEERKKLREQEDESDNNNYSISDFDSNQQQQQQQDFYNKINESELKPIQCYQVLENNSNGIQEKECFQKFFQFFNQQNMKILSLFSETAIFEVIGEKVHNIESTIQALSTNFSSMELDQIEQIVIQDDIIFNAQGNAKMHNSIKIPFIVSAKIASFDEWQSKIFHIKLKLNF